MTRAAIFWVLMLIALVLGCFGRYSPVITNAMLFVLLALLGWQVYGPVIKG